VDLKIQGKKALVTGGASGIGRSIVLGLADEGVSVAFTSRNSQRGEQLLSELGGLESNHIFLNLDISETSGPKKVLKTLNERNFQPEILINNIGDTLGIVDPECSTTDWQSIYRLNLEVHVELVNLLLPFMKEKRWGRIVNITAGAALENSGPVPYSTMKAAYTAYTRSMARVLAPTGIVMSAVLPGVVLTEDGHWNKVLQERPEHAAKYLEERTSLKRFGTPEEITPFVLLLSSKLASFAVGSIVPVEGGQARHFFAGNLEAYA
jgi:NAD(P)-dependent dehydrogenase (short-subunit alcohol dehydrogenase family)